jgi:hypothetical protein
MIAKVSSLLDEDKLCYVIINLCEKIMAEEKVTHVMAMPLRKRCDLVEKRLEELRQKRKQNEQRQRKQKRR